MNIIIIPVIIILMVQNIQKMITIRNLENEKKMIDNNIEFEDPQDEEIIQLVNRTVYLRSIKWVPFTVFIVSFFLTYVFVTIYLKETVSSQIVNTEIVNTPTTVTNDGSNNTNDNQINDNNNNNNKDDATSPTNNDSTIDDTKPRPGTPITNPNQPASQPTTPGDIPISMKQLTLKNSIKGNGPNNISP
jgi:cytoskeletal protein RodZ